MEGLAFALVAISEPCAQSMVEDRYAFVVNAAIVVLSMGCLAAGSRYA